MKKRIVYFQSINKAIKGLLFVPILFLLFSVEKLNAQVEKKDLVKKGDSVFYQNKPYTGVAVKYAQSKEVKNGNQTTLIAERWLREKDEYLNGIVQKRTEYQYSEEKKVELDYVGGQYTEWYETPAGAKPQVKASGPFTKGLIKKAKRQGEWTYYYNTGKLYFKSNYDNDKLNGKATYYHENGKLREEGTHKNNKREGTWSVYDEQGKKKYECVYAKNQEVSRKYEKGVTPEKTIEKKPLNGSGLAAILMLPLSLLYGFK